MQSGFLNLLQIRIQQKIALFDMVSGSNMCREGAPLSVTVSSPMWIRSSAP